MANAVYPLWKQAVMSATPLSDLVQNTVPDGPYCALVDTGVYTYSAAHQFYSSVTSAQGIDQRVVAPVVNTSGTFSGSNLTYTAVSGVSIEALVVYRHNSGASTTWRLVVYIDTGVTGLPVTPNGGDITITWDAAGIFTL